MMTYCSEVIDTCLFFRKYLTDNVNTMAANLTGNQLNVVRKHASFVLLANAIIMTGQVRAIAEVTTAVARGDLSKKITTDVQGEILELKNTINTMVDQLNSFASEVTRVAGEVIPPSCCLLQ